MSVDGPYLVDSAKQFPYGLVLVGEITKKLEYDPDRKAEDRRQDRHKVTGQPLYRAMLLDMDPEAREKTFEVTIAADVQPVAPGLAAGSPIRLVQLEGLEISVRTKVVGKDWKSKQDITKVVYYLTATGVSAVKPASGEGPKAV